MFEPEVTFTNNPSSTSPSPSSKSPFPHGPEPYRTFQILKTNPLALQSISVYLLIHPTGGNSPTGSPVYHTSKFSAMRQRPWLPPSFSIFEGGAPDAEKGFRDDRGKKIESKGKDREERDDERGEEVGMEMQEIGKGKEKKNKPGRIGKIKYLGWQGLIGLRSECTTWKILPSSTSTSNTQTSEPTKFSLSRDGAGRSYTLLFPTTSSSSTTSPLSLRYPKGLIWKGSTSSISSFQLSNNQPPKPSAHGGLKLLDPSRPENGVLAIWQNKTDLSLLGNLIIFEKFDEGEGENGGLEEVIISCLDVVMAERISGRGWVGGFGKGRGKGVEDAKEVKVKGD